MKIPTSLRRALRYAALRFAKALHDATMTYGCYECCGPFRFVYLDSQVVVCDEHYHPAEGQPDVEFATPFEPMPERRFFLLLEAVDQGWLPPGAKVGEVAR